MGRGVCDNEIRNINKQVDHRLLQCFPHVRTQAHQMYFAFPDKPTHRSPRHLNAQISP